MGRGRRQQYEQQYAELEQYLSDDDNSKGTDKIITQEELQGVELGKAVLLDNLPITTSDKVSVDYVIISFLKD